jgi:energy-coupling factor transport system substrate-specific component
MEIYKKNWLKYILCIIGCLLFRLIPIRPPNIEPILATLMPTSSVYGAVPGFLFAFLSIVSYDLITGTVGVGTLVTSASYGMLGIGANFYFKRKKNKNNNALNYALFAILGIIFFDAMTGLTIGPIFFHQSFMGAFMGQIPFTLWHLIGNISFALVLSPAIFNFIIRKEKFYEKQEKVHIVA